jgi:hypothetical protein
MRIGLTIAFVPVWVTLGPDAIVGWAATLRAGGVE